MAGRAPRNDEPSGSPAAGWLHRLELAAGASPGELVRHVHEVAPRSASGLPLPDWVPAELAAALGRQGIEALWSHQRSTAQAARDGEPVVVATGTASGKSLGFLLPVLTAVLDGARAPTGRGATALYLAPTKALAHDQLERVQALALPGLRAATLDGDTDPEQRRWVREHAAYVLTNPDLLHHSLLPAHERWAPFLRALRYVVVDECHVYRGVFGGHVALVLRRLRRVAARYRAAPTFVLASATVADPGGHATALVGMPVRPVSEDGSPRAALTIGLWQPPRDGPRPSQQRSAITETGRLLAELVREGVQTVAFARSRAGAETVAAIARQRVAGPGAGAGNGEAGDGAGDGAGEGAIAAYRGGFLPEERRELEGLLRSGRLRGLAATTALELGIDISGLDAVLLAGWPGTLSSFWQQVGRAGRAGRSALAVLVAADDPLDRYLVEHPQAIFDRPVEAAVLDLANPHLLGPHLACAAREVPIRPDEAEEAFGAAAPQVLADLTAHRVLRRRPDGWYWPHPHRPSDEVALRGVGPTLRIVERRTGRVLGFVEQARADVTVHLGAVYLHQGQPYVVVERDDDALAAVVVAGDPGWSTVARTVTECALGAVRADSDLGRLRMSLGEVSVRSRVTSFLRRRADGTVLGEHPLDLPQRRLDTVGTWWTMTEPPVTGVRLAGALHALEHASLALLPLVAGADRRDVGGLSSPSHPDTGLPTVLVHDGYPGGAGFSERAYAARACWLAAARTAVAQCGCAAGCPSCVQSAACGQGNSPLDKAGALALLEQIAECLGE